MLRDGRALAIAPEALLIARDGDVEALPWFQFRSADWDGDRRVLTLHPVSSTKADLIFETENDQVFAFTTGVRERIESSIVHAVTRELAGDHLVQILIRRDEAGELFSQTVVSGDADFVAAHRSEIDAIERSARQAVGLPG